MFGADTPLVMDALQMTALACAVGGGLMYLALRARSGSRGPDAPDTPDTPDTLAEPSDLEERVRVLERIATDQPAVLANEIEALRDETRQLETSA